MLVAVNDKGRLTFVINLKLRIVNFRCGSRRRKGASLFDMDLCGVPSGAGSSHGRC